MIIGIGIRQSVLTSVISYIGVVVGYISLLYLYPKFLEPEQIGLLRTIQDAAMLMVPFATMGLAQGILRYFPQHSKSPSQTNAFTGLMILLAVGGYALFTLVFYAFESRILSFFEENANAVIEYKNLILALIFLLLFTTLFEQLSKSILKVAFPNFLRDIVVRMLQAVLVTLYYFEFLNFHEFLISSVLIYALTLTILVFYLGKNDIRVRFNDLSQFSFNKIREILQYSSLSFIGVSAMILIGKIDSIMVTGFLGLASVAIYTTAFYMATVIEIPKRAITQTTTTLLSRAFEQNDNAQIHSLYRKASLHQCIVGSLLMIGVWANLENIFLFMPNGDVYQQGSNVVILVGIAKLIDMTFGPSSEIISLSPYYKFNLVCITLLAVLVVTSNYLLIPELGIIGAAYGSVLALVVYNVVKFIFIYIKLKMHPFSRQTLIVVAISLIALLVNFLLPKVSHVLVDMVYRSTVITLIFSVLIIASKCSQEINNIYWKILRYAGLKK